MKCKSCGKSDVEFSKRYNKQNNKFYVRSTCKNCDSIKFKDWQIRNIDYNRLRAIKYYYDNKAVNDENRKRRRKLTDEQRILAKRIKSNNRATFAKNARVKWDLDLTNFVYSEAHALRIIRNDLLGIEWNVDHIIPLKGSNVCGLHVWGNFQVITKQQNLKKGNYHGM